MSYIRLSITDAEQTINGQVHGSIGDAVVASLTAEPVTIQELELAVARFRRPHGDSPPFLSFREGEHLEPIDAGIVVVDLAARVVAVDSTYSSSAASGSIAYHDGEKLTDVVVPYRLSDDWLFVDSVPEYEGVRRERRAERETQTPVDARQVLYGKRLSEFIAREVLSLLATPKL